MKVLIAEDDVLQGELLFKLISSWGHVVCLAENAGQVLEQTRSERFDLFILDMFLPDTTALELIPHVKAMQPDARIITVTGQSSRELERRLRELGISYYMAQPIERKELQSLLSHLSERTQHQRIRSTNPSSVLPG